jgi:organic radical activating enzyme
MSKLSATAQFLPLVEEFYTLQGEGAQTGRAACFIRLGGCDVGCPWCDAKESWNPKIHPPVEVSEIVRRATAYPARTVVITGGEPLIYPLDELTAQLHEKGLQIFLETSGSHPFSGTFDWVCLSPKKQRPPLPGAWSHADELKVIISTPEDLQWAEECASKLPAAKTILLLQPEWSRADEMTPLIIDHIKQNPRWRISLQTHKYMQIP